METRRSLKAILVGWFVVVQWEIQRLATTAFLLAPVHQRQTTRLLSWAADDCRQSSFASIPNDPSHVGFLPSDSMREQPGQQVRLPESPYPFAAMLQMSARYIADHAGGTVVFHVPGDLMNSDGFETLISDIALSRTLGLKVVLVSSCRYRHKNSPWFFRECQTSTIHDIGVDACMRRIEEEAGYVRFEMERRLNRCLRSGGNVVGGHFYTAKPYQAMLGDDFRYSGYANRVHVEKLSRALATDDIVLLTTVGICSRGEAVHVDGIHLAAKVAASLKAKKLILMAEEGTVLHVDGEDKHLGELPIGFVDRLLTHHNVQAFDEGYIDMDLESQNLSSSSVEMLKHLAWSKWAMENGVDRAHIINPGDGALLEEVFTAKHGANTCIYKDEHEELSPVENVSFA